MFPCALDVAISPAVDVVFSAAAALAVVTSGVVVVVVVVVVLHGKSTHNIASFFARLLFGSLVLVPSLATYLLFLELSTSDLTTSLQHQLMIISKFRNI